MIKRNLKIPMKILISSFVSNYNFSNEHQHKKEIYLNIDQNFKMNCFSGENIYLNNISL